MNKYLIILLILTSNLFFIKESKAYPAAIRFGYPNCTSCHYNPSGGMTLTPYGRALSRELISTFGNEGEEAFLWGITEKIRPFWLDLGGDFRISNVQNTKKPEKSVSRMTVADLEAVVGTEKKRAVVDIGFREIPIGKSKEGTPLFDHELFSRRHYLEYNLNDYISIRGGKFSPNFGLWNADPSNSVRLGLGLGDLSETYNLELNYIGEEVSYSLTSVLGADQRSSNLGEKGIFFTSSKTYNSTYKIGIGGFYRDNDTFKRSALGEFSLLGFSQRTYLYSEAYIQDVENKIKNNESLGFYTFNRFGYEFFLKQAFFLLISQDMTISKLGDNSTRKEYFSLGFQWMPRPHLEFQTHWRKARDFSVGPDFGNEFIFNFHMYH
jgi:hypothetical protein